MSEAMLEKDMRPNRYIVMLRHVQAYIRDFFEQNPISQLSVHGMYDGKCMQLSELSGNPNDHILALEDLRTGGREKVPIQPKGAPSLQNALDMSRAILFHTPKHGTREVLIILGALLTNDPGDISKTIATCVKDRLKVSIIGMLARMKVCQDIVSRTNDGDESGYTVAVDQIHFRELLRQNTTPPAVRTSDQEANMANLLVMGFPSRMEEEEASLCACHGRLVRGGYNCPRCATKVCSLPQTCPACALTLILSTHLARSYHHLFPLRSFGEVSWARAKRMGTLQCKGCLRQFPPVPDDVQQPSSDERGNRALGGSLVEGSSESGRYECETCHNHFCVDCDVFCHQALFNCPGCLSGQPVDVPRDRARASNGVLDQEEVMDGVERSINTA
jgi:transcription initiation factor TFIIH subunit 2